MRNFQKYGFIFMLLAILFLCGCRHSRNGKSLSGETIEVNLFESVVTTVESNAAESAVETEYFPDGPTTPETTLQESDPEVRDLQSYDAWNEKNNQEEVAMMLEDAFSRLEFDASQDDISGISRMVSGFYFFAMYCSDEPNKTIQFADIIPKPEYIPEEAIYVNYAFLFIDEQNNNYIYYLSDPFGALGRELLYKNDELIYDGFMMT